MAKSDSTGGKSIRAEMSGKKFGHLTVDSYYDTRKKRARWICTCECGKSVVVDGKSLRQGNTVSCGCQKRFRIANFKFLHGATRGGRKTAEYEIWTGMIKRCSSKKCASYRYYGGRGIRVCERWRDFRNFLEDMGPRPSSRSQIDRINNDGDYEPDNCRWSDFTTQARNRSSTRYVAFGGKIQCVKAWADELGIKPSTIYARLDRGYSPERALATPR